MKRLSPRSRIAFLSAGPPPVVRHVPQSEYSLRFDRRGPVFPPGVRGGWSRHPGSLPILIVPT